MAGGSFIYSLLRGGTDVQEYWRYCAGSADSSGDRFKNTATSRLLCGGSLSEAV